MSDWSEARKVLLQGGVAVLPTDTIYGLHCLATNNAGIERIYKLKGRDASKPFIVLISSLDDLKPFGVKLDDKLTALLKDYWPGPNSIILPIPDADGKLAYLHRGTKSLAFRLPAYKPLLTLLQQTGPLVSTSANPSGHPPASDIAGARAYFFNSVDFYLDAGKLTNPPSHVYSLSDGVLVGVR